MHIDGAMEHLDISDHNMITPTYKIPTEGVSFKKGKEVKRTYYKVDGESQLQFSTEMKKSLELQDIEQFEGLNKVMKEFPDKTLRATYCRKISNKQDVKEQPWISPEIWKAINKRKEINRKSRNTQNMKEREELSQDYIEQKYKAQLLVKDAVTKYEKKITDN